MLLQITTAFLLKTTTKFLQIASKLLQITTAITNYDNFLQITTEHML